MEMSPPPVTPKLLRRSSSDRIFGGVCGGLGRYWNVDPVVLRVAFGVSLLLGGFGLFAYLAMWLLVPDETAPADARISESWGLRIVGSVVAFIAAMIGLGLLFSDSVGGGGVVLGALMAAIVVWIVMSQRPASPPVAEPEPGYAYGGSGGYTPTTMLEQPPAPPTAPRERSYLGLIGLCAAIAATGVALLLTDNPTVVLATGLLVLGITLLVSAFRGRARWLMLFAVPLLLVLAMVSQVQRADITTGEVTWFPSPEQTSYSLTAGTLDVAFDDWEGQPGQGDQVNVDLGVGEVRIAAPRNWDLVVVSDIRAGGVQVDGRPVDSQSFSSLDRTRIPASSGKAEGTMLVDVTVTAGAVVVETGAPAAGGEPETAPRENQTKKEKAA